MPLSSATSDRDPTPKDLGLFNIFRDLPEAKLAKVCDIIEIERFAANETVVRDGEVGETLYLLFSDIGCRAWWPVC